MSDKPKRERGANYTVEEKALLSELVNQYRHIIEDKRAGGIFLVKKKETWQQIASKYNSNCTTGRREIEQLKALYDNMKQKARKTVGESNACNKNTYSQEDDNYEFTLNEPIPIKVEIAETEPVAATPEYNQMPLYSTIPVEPPTELVINHCTAQKRLTTNRKCFRPNDLPPMKLRKNMSADALKRLYFKKKCENAYLEKKKLIHEIFYHNQEHKLKMKIMEKQLESLNK